MTPRLKTGCTHSKHAKDREEKLAILRRVELYKVGHHGSLNATPKSLWHFST